MSSPELSRWMALDRLYGYPDIYFLAAAIVSAFSGAEAVKDLVPIFSAGAAQNVGDHKAAFAAMAARSRPQ